jgi:hypothetical protein
MINNPNRRSVPGFFFLGVAEETTVEQGAVYTAETGEEEHIEPRGWAMKWGGVALWQIRGQQTGLGPLSVDVPTERT